MMMMMMTRQAYGVWSYDTSVSVEIIARLGAEDAKNVIDRISRYASWLEFHRIAVSEEVFPR